MTYPDLQFATPADRPLFYTNFVQTIDGKIQVKTDPKGYWPIGSETDYATLIELRAHADVLIHGKGTATWIRTIDNLAKPAFQEQRLALGKTKPILYCIISAHPTIELLPYLENPPLGCKTLLVTTELIELDAAWDNIAVLRIGKESVDLIALANYLFNHHYTIGLVEGGPTLLGSFLKDELIDEVFVTIAPKIIGNRPNSTLTMVEGELFTHETIKQFRLISTQAIGDEVYLHYQTKRKAAA